MFEPGDLIRANINLYYVVEKEADIYTLVCIDNPKNGLFNIYCLTAEQLSSIYTNFFKKENT